LAFECKPKLSVFNICVDNIATEGSITCPHYELEVVFLKPDLIRAFAELDLVYSFESADFKISGTWHQGKPEAKGKSLSQVFLTDEENLPPVKVIQIPLGKWVNYQTTNPHRSEGTKDISAGTGVIVVDGRVFIGYLLRKKEALALERRILEFETSHTIGFPSYPMYF